MEFEFDPAKSASNQAKHGIDFVEAQKLWSDLDRIIILVASTRETREMVVGKIDEKMWTAVVTDRNGKIRIISVRRGREKEVLQYESQKDQS